MLSVNTHEYMSMEWFVVCLGVYIVYKNVFRLCKLTKNQVKYMSSVTSHVNSYWQYIEREVNYGLSYGSHGDSGVTVNYGSSLSSITFFLRQCSSCTNTVAVELQMSWQNLFFFKNVALFEWRGMVVISIISGQHGYKIAHLLLWLNYLHLSWVSRVL